MFKKVLLVEDNDGDIRLIEEVIADHNLKITLEVLSDGGQFLEYIEEKKLNPKDLPKIIILDLNLPKVQGKVLLEKIKSEPVFKRIPVLILTTSSLSSDINECYEMGANAYMIKPIDIFEFFEMIQIIDKFWLRISVLSGN